VALSAIVSQANDGSAGSLANATVEFDLVKSSNLSNVPDYRFYAAANASGIASATGSLPVDTYTVSAKIAPPGAPGLPSGAPVGYYMSPVSDPAVLTVYQPITGVWATGGGWVVDPSTQNKPVSISTTNNHGNFGFNVRYRKGTTSPEGQSVYTFRGSDGYDYIVKSNSWVGGGAAFSPTTASFSGKATVIIIDPVTGRQVGGGGNYTYRVDVVDGTPDSYAISVYTPAGSLYHQVGTTAAQIPLGGGSIVLHT
jgi:hypothetical protein